jgi:magnesium chelatase family protein
METMSLATVYSRAQEGVHSPLVSIEVHVANGLPSLSIVGLPETAVRESKDRVRGALLNSRFEFPARRITINMAPADLPKEGSRFDLPMAIGMLAATRQLPDTVLSQYEFVGELALDGSLRPIRGILPVSLKAREAKRILICPRENAQEAALVNGARVLPAAHLLDICTHLRGNCDLMPAPGPPNDDVGSQDNADMADVRGQPHARRALEIAASGGHNLLMVGPPGTGKSMLASRLPGILPPMTDEEALESAAILSITPHGVDSRRWRQRPFRNPHHTASGVALVGGGSHPKPGEISLAHHGVMFLDELPEFNRKVLEVLREPLETGTITISRAARQAEYPARFQLVAAMNPCPCGYLGDSSGRCHCTPDQVRRYRNRISGPLLDRFDMHIEVPRLGHAKLTRAPRGEPSSQVRERVIAARNRQYRRQDNANHAMNSQMVDEHCRLDEENQLLLEQAMEKLGLSARAWQRILKLSRTIADLDESDSIETRHLTEALSYRALDRSVAPG